MQHEAPPDPISRDRFRLVDPQPPPAQPPRRRWACEVAELLAEAGAQLRQATSVLDAPPQVRCALVALVQDVARVEGVALWAAEELLEVPGPDGRAS